MKPYVDNQSNDYKIRTFSKDIEETELLWHRDEKDRKIIPLNDNDWLYQLDNELPIEMKRNIGFNIPKNTFHRVIKGKTDLIVKIIE